ncbi:Enteropeptidase-like protein [Dinothrombium tinctorium]|uniref:Enteropeptidase-like protein n=1 Tax=Dinothrombium tinctorium TaxID=1965070 RepID=A0A443QV36_9ACAR|nr:Enteropeptidase-like protein [Dinothrombium tinctorium]
MQNHSNDIALIKMDKPVNFSGNESHLKPACLDLIGIEKDLNNETRCVATGFGRLGHGSSPLPVILQQLEMKPYDHDECARIHHIFYSIEESKEEVTQKQFCMISKHNLDPESYESFGGACPGDSGGPLQCYINDNWIQLGVTWSGTDCERSPTVFQKIYKYATFIIQTSGYKLPSSCKVHFFEDKINKRKEIKAQQNNSSQQETTNSDKILILILSLLNIPLINNRTS